jgi:TonB family protein
MPEPVSCGHFENLAALYALGELEAPVRAGIEAHVRACSHCAAVLRHETALADVLASGSRADDQQEPSDLLLARCRSDLSKSLDAAAASRPRGWGALFSLRSWGAAFRISANFHPAWSVAALLLVAAVAGLAGWEGVGRAPLQRLGPAVMTVFAAPAPVPGVASASPVTPTGANAAPQPPAPNPPVVDGVAGDTHVYAATDAGMNDALPPNLFEADTAQGPAQQPAARIPRRGEPMPRTWRHEPPMRMPDGVSPAAAWDAPSRGRLADLSRRMERLWWGGVRVDPAEQQQRLLHSPPPEYPEVARRAGIDGQVTLLVRIGSDGSVEGTTLLSGEPVLGRAAAEAVDQWRYAPLRIGGQPVDILTSVTFAFELR